MGLTVKFSSKKMAFKKHIPWNKGLTKETDERVKKASKNLKRLYKEKKVNCGFKKGNIPCNKGKNKNNYEPMKKASNILKKQYKNGRINWQKKLGNNHPKVIAYKKKVSKRAIEIHTGRECSEKTRKRISISNTGRKNSKPFSDETKRKMRVSAINYIKKNCKGFKPRIGKNEKRILDELEQELNYKIIRQYYIKNIGYFVDGYISELNLVIEIYENHHYMINNRLKKKELKREKEIKGKLNCKFMRIKDGTK